MRSPGVQLYRWLSPQLRSVAATSYGVYLKAWRYGAETEQLIAEALERERWSSERIRSWQEERLNHVLNRAATKVPYYRHHWEKRRLNGDRASWENLKNWPILEKDTLRKHPKAFVADDCSIRRMYHEHTSGTTGKPLDLWWSKQTVRTWYALFEARCRLWNGVSRQDRWAILGGRLVTPSVRRKPPFWVWNAALNQLYCSSYHLSPDLIPAYCTALTQYRINHLVGYPSSMYALARGILAMKKRVPITVAITNAEPIFDYQREAISEAFQCNVRETYGMAEIVAAASECAEGGLHDWPEVGWLEAMDSNENADSSWGDLVSTGLLNDDMILVRYRVGDRVSLASPTKRCHCGRSLPLIRSVGGRCDDVLFTSDGREIGRLDPVFKANLPIREAQIIQESLERVRVIVVPESSFGSDSRHSIVERLVERMGRVKVIVEEVSEVPRDHNGKFRAVICKLPKEIVSELRRGRTRSD